MFMVVLCRACHDCNRGDTLLPIYLVVQEFSSLAIKILKCKMHKTSLSKKKKTSMLAHSCCQVPILTNRDLIPEDLL